MLNVNLLGSLYYFLRRHFTLHIFIPLLIGAIVDAAFIHYLDNISWYDAFKKLGTSLQHIIPILSIFFTYSLISYLGVRKETTLRFNPDNLFEVEDIVLQAKSYFALSPLPAREWFSPGIVRYFSILLGRHMQPDQPEAGKFSYSRVVVFTSPRRQAFAKAPYIDREYSLAFGRLHRDSRIPLGVLKPRALYAILQKLSPETRKVFVPLPLFVLKIIRNPLFYRLMSPFLRLDFALIDYGNRKTVLLEPTGCGAVNELSGDSIKPYEELVNAIKEMIYYKDNNDNQVKFKRAADFMKMIEES